MLTFNELMMSRSWGPIRNCPGRYVLRGARPDLSVDELLGAGHHTLRFDVETARDKILVTALDEGGVISYERANGTYLHTLNTAEGFRRKLLELGIEPGSNAGGK